MSLWLVGAGSMALDYAKVLQRIGCEFEVIGRSALSAEKFTLTTGYPVRLGGLRAVLKDYPAPNQAIVAVGVEQLFEITTELILSGTRRILVEKPGGLNSKQIHDLHQTALNHGSEVLIAYNRRFYASTTMARKLITEDGGATSCNFEFTEWSHIIAPMSTASEVKAAWFLANSTHVVDLAFHLCGTPHDWKSWYGGELHWHPTSARFCGSGITQKGVYFSYNADWEAPGRWGIEVLTRKRRFIFKPMEQLQVVLLGSVKVETIALDDHFDKEFKPGLYAQTKAFIEGDGSYFCTLGEQLQHCTFYDKISGYGDDSALKS